MNPTTWTYVLYLPISVALTVWVARTLHRNGRVFLIDRFHGNTELADNVNHLLVVGFYLINIGYITLALRYGNKPESLQGAIEFLSTKVGLVLLVLGAMHFFNLMVFSKMKQHSRDQPDTDPAPRPSDAPANHAALAAYHRAKATREPTPGEVT